MLGILIPHPMMKLAKAIAESKDVNSLSSDNDLQLKFQISQDEMFCDLIFGVDPGIVRRK